MEIIIFGALYSGLTELCKKWGWNPQICTIGFALLGGIVYTLFTIYFPETFQQKIHVFAVSSLSTAVFIYEYIIKGLKK